MKGKYQKIEINMRRENDSYKMWKQGNDSTVCRVESYKGKRSILFHCENLLPSRILEEEEKEYHLLLIGTAEERVVHQDFGPVQVKETGITQAYFTFEGPSLDAYQYCIFCTVHRSGETETLYKGPIGKGLPTVAWERWCQEKHRVEAFTPSCDETSAKWFRVEEMEDLPEALIPCRRWIEHYGHYIIGKKKQTYFVGIPGRFLQREQPLRQESVFLLWQPMRGGETFFSCPETMSPKEIEQIFGYWIAKAEANGETLKPL